MACGVSKPAVVVALVSATLLSVVWMSGSIKPIFSGFTAKMASLPSPLQVQASAQEETIISRHETSKASIRTTSSSRLISRPKPSRDPHPTRKSSLPTTKISLPKTSTSLPTKRTSISTTATSVSTTKTSLPKTKTSENSFTNSPVHSRVPVAGCKIPEYNAFDPKVMKFIKTLQPHKCTREQGLTSVQGDTLTLNAAWLDKRKQRLLNCSFQAINRDSENAISFSKPTVFNSTVRPSADFIRVVCYTKEKSSSQGRNYTALHSVMAAKPDVEDVLDTRMRHYLKNRTSASSGQAEERQRPLSVVMVGVDSVSRLNMIRHLQRTRYFLLERMQAIDLVNYNKIGLNTFPNMLAMMTGRPRSNYSQPVLKKRPMDMLNTSFLWDEAAQLGYRTLFAEDYPQISIFNFAANGFKNPPTHYYYRPFELAKTKNKKLFGDGRNCYGTQPNDELILDYNLAFQRLFWDKPHFGLTFLTRSTHGTTNGASQIDDYHTRYLTSLVEEGLVNNTLFIFFSDHGIRWGDVRNTPQGGFEDNRPFMYLVFPPWFRERYPDLLHRVQQNAAHLVTPLDIHNTILDVFNLFHTDPPSARVTRPVFGISLFDEIPADRTCADAHIPLLFCVCLKNQPLNTSAPFAHQAGNALVASLNAALKKGSVTDKCHALQLRNVSKALEIEEGGQYVRNQCPSGQSKREERLYRLTLFTKPGNGKFESMMFQCNRTSEILVFGDIDRTSQYGNSSFCVKDSLLKKICLCKNV